MGSAVSPKASAAGRRIKGQVIYPSPGTDIRTVQSLMGHSSVETTMIYLHVMKRPGAGAPSPLDLD